MVLIRNILSFIILVILCAYAAWKEMQTLATVCIFLILCILYIELVNKAFNIVFSLAKQTKQAKFRNFEFQLTDINKQVIMDCIEPDKKWAKAIISDLNATHIALLLAIHKEGSLKCSDQIKNNLRDLRDKGLLEHDKDSIKNSDIVWLSDLGNELAGTIANLSDDDAG
jgi:hypothetical protein